MRSYKAKVKIYKRKNSKQYLITLKKDNPFDEDENVLIIPESDIDEIEQINKDMEDSIKVRENIINDLKEELRELKELKEFKIKYELLLNDMDRLRASKDHLQERLNKSQDELIQLERTLNKYRIVINKVQGLSLMDRILNRLPDDIKKLPEVAKK